MLSHREQSLSSVMCAILGPRIISSTWRRPNPEILSGRFLVALGFYPDFPEAPKWAIFIPGHPKLGKAGKCPNSKPRRSNST